LTSVAEAPNKRAPSKWHAIARHTPGRTSKDCRKKWHATVGLGSRGTWTAAEDERLVWAVERLGRWALVAGMVQTRNGEQCAKRWCDTLDPSIDRTAWSKEQEELLVKGVAEHGKAWTKIVQLYFPRRTGLAAKNR
ncbi:Homeodomain-like protein, partial [Mycena pura]